MGALWGVILSILVKKIITSELDSHKVLVTSGFVTKLRIVNKGWIALCNG